MARNKPIEKGLRLLCLQSVCNRGLEKKLLISI